MKGKSFHYQNETLIDERKKVISTGNPYQIIQDLEQIGQVKLKLNYKQFQKLISYIHQFKTSEDMKNILKAHHMWKDKLVF